MSRFPGHVERRIFDAVLLVLAACDRPPEPQPPRPSRTTSPAPSDAANTHTVIADTATADATNPDATAVPVPIDAGIVTRAPVPGSQADAWRLCKDHKKRARVDRATARQGKPPMEGNSVHDSAIWDTKAGAAVCTIVRERAHGQVTVMHTPHWCPAGGGQRPGPSPREVPGENILIERVTLLADGTVAKQDVEWTAFGMVHEPRHNCGRRFEGLVLDDLGRDERADRTSVGAELAAMAELEAASVPAFERLARELAAWGAPPELVDRARNAMRDEVRHARVMTVLATRHGHTPRAIVVPPLPCRALAAIALENAIEGCVREAYGALVATYQAQRASAELRRAFRVIAADERRHAALAEDIHAWILDQLDASSREAIEHARAVAQAELRVGVATSRACPELGLPGGAEAAALCDAFFA